MNEYNFEDIYEGMEEKFEIAMSEEKFALFRDLSGDINPLHCSEKFALSKGFPKKVMYGMAVASLYSTLVGVYLPGKNCLLQSVKIDFNKPVWEDDKLNVSGIVIKKHATTRRIEIKAVIRRENGEKVSGAKIEAGVI